MRKIVTEKNAKKNCNRGTALETVNRKTNEELKPVLLARNPNLNSGAAPYYEFRFGPHKVLYLIYETPMWNTYNQKHCFKTKQNGSMALSQPQLYG